VKEIIVTDTIPRATSSRAPAFRVVSVAPLLGECIKRIHPN